MPMTVITMQSSVLSLRGDLTKWMQEIATGVFIGNFNSKIREQLWERVKQNIGRGQATLSYYSRDELGYTFKTYQTERSVVDYDGIQLVKFPSSSVEKGNLLQGFSNASKFQKIKKFSGTATKKDTLSVNYVILYIDSEKLNDTESNSIEIACIKVCKNKITKCCYSVQKTNIILERISEDLGPVEIISKNDDILISDSLENLLSFIENFPIIGYFIDRDITFLNNVLQKEGKAPLINKRYDLLKFVKKQNMFLDNYQLETVLATYGVGEKLSNTTLDNVELIYQLAIHVDGFISSLKN